MGGKGETKGGEGKNPVFFLKRPSGLQPHRKLEKTLVTRQKNSVWRREGSQEEVA